MSAFWKTLLHAAASAAVVSTAETLKTGAAITSGNVLIPAAVAALAGALHAMAPSTLDTSRDE